MKTSYSIFCFRVGGINVLIAALLVLSPFSFSSPAGAQPVPRVALVTRTVPVPGSDVAYVEHLTSRGWEVTAIDDDEIRDSGAQAISGYDLVVISSTVYAQRIRWRLRSAPEPIIVAKQKLFVAFGLSGRAAGDSGFTTSSRKVVIADPNSSLSAGFSERLIVSTKAKPMNFSKVGPDAYVIATAKDSAEQAVIFGYEAGSQLFDGSIASGPRVGFYMTQPHPRFANRDGWALFDAVAAWVSPNAPAPGTDAPSFAPVALENGILLGADIGRGSLPNGYEATLAAEQILGRKFDIINRNHEFSAGLNSSFFWDRKHIDDGRTLLISWRATDNPGSTNGAPDPQRARKIVAGQFDSTIEAMATAMRDLEAPVLLMFNWEMDQAPGQPQYIGTPEEFIAAWRYVHDIFERRGATNVEWVWAPRARSFTKGIGQTFYPGYDYVDWVGGLAVPINSFDDPRTIYTAWNDWATSIGKPQLLWLGLRENPDSASWKPGFINEVTSLVSGEWGGVKALVYYSNDSPLGYDYYFNTSTASLNAFRNLSCNDPFIARNRCGGSDVDSGGNGSSSAPRPPSAPSIQGFETVTVQTVTPTPVARTAAPSIEMEQTVSEPPASSPAPAPVARLNEPDDNANLAADDSVSDNEPDEWTPSASWQLEGKANVVLTVGDVVFVGGAFTHIYNDAGRRLPRSYFAALDRQSGRPLNFAPAFDNEVRALATSPDKKILYVGGAFLTANGEKRRRVAAFDLASGRMTDFAPPAPNSGLRAIAVTEYRVYLGGRFRTVGGTEKQYLAAFDPVTSELDTTFAAKPNNEVTGLIAGPDGLWIGGKHTRMNGISQQGIALVDPVDGSLISSEAVAYPVLALAASDDQIFLAGGGRGGRAAAFSRATATKQWEIPSDGDFQAVAVGEGDYVYFGGHYEKIIGDQTLDRLTRHARTTGEPDRSWVHKINGIRSINSIDVRSDGLYIGGDFSRVNTLPREGFAIMPGRTR